MAQVIEHIVKPVKAQEGSKQRTSSEGTSSAGASGQGTSDQSLHVKKPGWFTVHVANRTVAWLTRRGFSVWGSRVLAVRGRKSGEWRRTPVNLLTLDGRRYLVAPRGHVQWTHNMRAAGGGQLLLGSHVEEFTATEVPDDEKPAILRAYLKRWKAEVGVFFDGVGPDSTDAELRAMAPKHPVFRVHALDGE